MPTPEEYYGQGLSDHAPLIVSLGRHARIGSSGCSILVFVCNHLDFKLQLDSMGGVLFIRCV